MRSPCGSTGLGQHTTPDSPARRLIVRPSAVPVPPRKPGALVVRYGEAPHSAMRRYVYHEVRARPSLAEDEGELAEVVKRAAARAGVTYEGSAVTRAERCRR